jgi:thiol:disulfide interchange protein
MKRLALALALAAPLAACATVPITADAAHPEAKPYAEHRNAMAAVDTALARAKQRGTRVLLVMGANWCHDSRALAGWLATPRFRAMTAQNYEVVFVDAGKPQEGKGHNIAVAQRFGIASLPGTPNLFVIRADGSLVNADTVTSWRNAASRSADAIFDELVALAHA